MPPLPLAVARGFAERARRREVRRHISFETPASKKLTALSLTPDNRLMNLEAEPEAPFWFVVGDDLDAPSPDPSEPDALDDLVMKVFPIVLDDP